MVIEKLKIFVFLILILTVQLWSVDSSLSILKVDLQKAEALALSNNFDITINSVKNQILVESKNEAWRAYLPQVGVNYSNNVMVAKRGPDTRSHELSLNLKQPIFDGGRASLQHKLAKLNIVLNKSEYKRMIDNVKLQVRVSFYNLIQAIEKLRIHQKSIIRTKLQLELTSKENKLGMVTKLDLIEVKSRLKEIQVEYYKMVRDYESLKLEFNQLLGVKRNLRIQYVARPLSEIPIQVNKRSLKEVLSIAYSKRPEIFQNKINVMKARVEYNITRSLLVPTLSLTSTYGLTGPEWPPRTKGWSVGFVIDTNLFGSTASNNSTANSSNNDYTKGYGTRSSLNVMDDPGFYKRRLESLVSLESASYEAKHLKDNIYLEIKKAYDILSSNYEIQKLAGERRDLVKERLMIEAKKVQLGGLKRIDLMETEMEYLQSAAGYISAKIEYIISVHKLEITMGVAPDFLSLVQ